MAWEHRGANAFEGAASGAALGGTVASIVPVGGTAIGAGIGAVLGGLWGLLSSTEQQELAERYQKGYIDPEEMSAISDALKRRFHTMQQRFGTDMARRGLTDSTIAARMQAELMAEEGNALADALSDVSWRNKRLGMDMQAEQAAARQQAIGQSVGVLGNLYLTDQENKRAAAADKRWADWMDRVYPGKTPATPAQPSKAVPASPRVTSSHARTKQGAVAVPPVKQGWQWDKGGGGKGAKDPLAGASNLRNRVHGRTS